MSMQIWYFQCYFMRFKKDILNILFKVTKPYLGLIFRTGGKNWGRISSQNYKEMLNGIRTWNVLKVRHLTNPWSKSCPNQVLSWSKFAVILCMERWCVYLLLPLSSPSLSSSLSQITPHRCCQRGALYSGQSFPCASLGFSCFTKFDHASISRRLCSPSSPRPPGL